MGHQTPSVEPFLIVEGGLKNSVTVGPPGSEGVFELEVNISKSEWGEVAEDFKSIVILEMDGTPLYDVTHVQISFKEGAPSGKTLAVITGILQKS